MCGRKAFNLTWREIHDLLEHGIFPERFEKLIRANFNVAPSQELPIIHRGAAARALTISRWGFVPTWWSKPEAPKHTINARAETIGTSNMFRGAFGAGRCVVPVSGYYEWRVLPGGGKRAYYIYRADRAPLLLAGVHATREDADTYAVITTTAPHGMEHLHDRSPVIIEPEDMDRWLDPHGTPAQAAALCRPAADGVLAWHPVSNAVGNVRNNGPELIRPIE